MGPIVMLVLAGLVACWIILSILGNERQRQLQQFDAIQHATRAKLAAAAAELATRKVQIPATPRQSAG
jgi:hypothetical protein